MTTSYTLNTKVFNKTKSPSPTATEFTTRDRGATLPDTLRISHKKTANKQEPGSVDQRTDCRIISTFINADGVVKQVEVALQYVIPDDCASADVDIAQSYLTDFLASAITLRAANVASLRNGEVA